jgi:hypothetical protein
VGAVPPLVGVAVNITLVPAQIAPDGLAPILTNGLREGLTLIVIVLLPAVVGEAHAALLVMVHVTTSPLFNAEEL